MEEDADAAAPTFVGRFNSATGTIEWVAETDHDYASELAASGYGDMLKDSERNKVYAEALSAVLGERPGAHVLDIGTGTGLLAMMAAGAGAGSVTACEAFDPMVSIAREAIADNKLSGTITVVPKRSTDMAVGLGLDMPQRADVVVSEILDTELIGEGVLGTMRHMHEHLAAPGATIIPGAATVHVQLFESEYLRGWHDPDHGGASAARGGVVLGLGECGGPASPHDVQANRFSSNDLLPMSTPTPALEFDFATPGGSGSALSGSKTFAVNADRAGVVDGIVFWWSLELTKDHAMSTAPDWARVPGTGSDSSFGCGGGGGSGDKGQWRDHWMQGVFLLPSRLTVSAGDAVDITACHDDYSLWFGASVGSSSDAGGSGGGAAGAAASAAAEVTTGKAPAATASPTTERPVCRCGIHVLWNPTRISALSDLDRNRRYSQAVTHALTTAPTAVVAGLSAAEAAALATCVCIGDGGYTALLAGTCINGKSGAMGAAKVIALEASPLSKRTVKKLVVKNRLSKLVSVLDDVEDVESVLLSSVASSSSSGGGGQDGGGEHASDGNHDGGAGSEDVKGMTASSPKLITALVAEPYFYSALLPWHGLKFWFAKETLAPLLAPGVQLVPSSARLRGQFVQFKHFQKTQEKVGTICGWDVSAYDRAVDGHYEADAPCAVWEYEHAVCSDPFTMLDFDFASSVQDVRGKATPAIKAPDGGKGGGGGGFGGGGGGTVEVNGLITWMDYDLSPGVTESGGPKRDAATGRCRPNYCRQSVRLLKPVKYAHGSGGGGFGGGGGGGSGGGGAALGPAVFSAFDAASGEVLIEVKHHHKTDLPG